MQRFLVIGAAIASALAIAACGGDDAPETPIIVDTEPTDSLSKEDFIAEADAICAEANSAISQIAAEGGGVTQAGEIASIRQGVIDQIEALGRPVDEGITGSPESDTGAGTETSTTSDVGSLGDAGTSAVETTAGSDALDLFLAAMADQVAAGEKIDLALQRDDAATQTEGEAELQTAKDAAAAAAADYGFEECGQEPSATATGDTGATDDTGAVPVTPAPAPAAPDTSGGGASPDTGGDTGDTGGTGGSGGGVGAP